ncbi:MAG: monovalent cation/H+ antiporter subunit D family protein [Thiothrix sp.]|nr:monovalent cation/H+ antiporter subunit D family protein [Thiothrix sp.]
MMSSQLPALQLVIPLLSAPLCFLIGKARIAWAIATLASWACAAIAVTLLLRVNDGSVIEYAFGNWPGPWGIVYTIDRLNAFVLVIVSGIAAVILPYSWPSVCREIPPRLHVLFYTALLLCLSGLLGMTITGDAFNLFVLLEISSLSTYTLISLGKDRRSLTAAFQYLVMGTIGGTFILIGVGLLYMLTGTLNMADLAHRLQPLEGSRTLQAAFAFLVVGFGLKLAMFPLHLWLPNAYATAPSVVSAFLAATATKVAVYAMLRFLFGIFGADFTYNQMHLQFLLVPLALMAILFASMTAVYQRGVKRMLAYSSLAQIGYMLLGIGLANLHGLMATLLHLFNHALIKGALFLVMANIFYRAGGTAINHVTGLGRQMPWSMAAFVAGGLSLIGVPLTVGFISKWYLIQASIDRGWWLITAMILLGSLIALVYIWRVVEAAYFKERPPDQPTVTEVPLWLLIPTWVLILGNIWFGMNAEFTAGVAEAAAATLLGER